MNGGAFDELSFALELHREHGRRLFRSTELLRALRRHLGEQTLPDVALHALVHSLVRSGLIGACSEPGLYRVTPKTVSRTAILASERALIPEQSIDAVTRLFLEEVLHEAEVPRELLDEIVHTYQLDGRIEMSEDGNRYVIRLSHRQ